MRSHDQIYFLGVAVLKEDLQEDSLHEKEITTPWIVI